MQVSQPRTQRTRDEGRKVIELRQLHRGPTTVDAYANRRPGLDWTESAPFDDEAGGDDSYADDSSTDPADACILIILEVHCDRLRRSCPAVEYDCLIRFARDEFRTRLRTWCSCRSTKVSRKEGRKERMNAKRNYWTTTSTVHVSD